MCKKLAMWYKLYFPIFWAFLPYLPGSFKLKATMLKNNLPHNDQFFPAPFTLSAGTQLSHISGWLFSLRIVCSCVFLFTENLSNSSLQNTHRVQYTYYTFGDRQMDGQTFVLLYAKRSINNARKTIVYRWEDLVARQLLLRRMTIAKWNILQWDLLKKEKSKVFYSYEKLGKRFHKGSQSTI